MKLPNIGRKRTPSGHTRSLIKVSSVVIGLYLNELLARGNPQITQAVVKTISSTPQAVGRVSLHKPMPPHVPCMLPKGKNKHHSSYKNFDLQCESPCKIYQDNSSTKLVAVTS